MGEMRKLARTVARAQGGLGASRLVSKRNRAKLVRHLEEEAAKKRQLDSLLGRVVGVHPGKERKLPVEGKPGLLQRVKRFLRKVVS